MGHRLTARTGLDFSLYRQSLSFICFMPSFSRFLEVFTDRLGTALSARIPAPGSPPQLTVGLGRYRFLPRRCNQFWLRSAVFFSMLAFVVKTMDACEMEMEKSNTSLNFKT